MKVSWSFSVHHLLSCCIHQVIHSLQPAVNEPSESALHGFSLELPHKEEIPACLSTNLFYILVERAGVSSHIDVESLSRAQSKDEI